MLAMKSDELACNPTDNTVNEKGPPKSKRTEYLVAAKSNI